LTITQAGLAVTGSVKMAVQVEDCANVVQRFTAKAGGADGC
jgi:hypothetical protein